MFHVKHIKIINGAHLNKFELRKNHRAQAQDKNQNNENIASTELSISLKILSEVKSGKNLNEVFNQNINNTNLNVSKIKDITYGVMRYYFILNAILNDLAKNEPQQEIKILLLIAFYEIKHTKKPAYAITNDIQIKNFTNAIIRNFLRTQTELEKKLASKLEYKYNFPEWIIVKLKKD